MIEREDQPFLGLGQRIEIDLVVDQPEDEHREHRQARHQRECGHSRECPGTRTPPARGSELAPRADQQQHDGDDHQQVGGPGQGLVGAGHECEVDHDAGDKEQPHLNRREARVLTAVVKQPLDGGERR